MGPGEAVLVADLNEATLHASAESGPLPLWSAVTGCHDRSLVEPPGRHQEVLAAWPKD